MKKKRELTTNAALAALQTPIEIALGIDTEGMTTARKLYSFLELNITQYSRWCNSNIKNNKYLILGEDYFYLDIHVEKYQDYKLTANCAKKLAMTGNTDRHNQARDYFIACEQGLKIATSKLVQQQSNQQIDMKPLTDAISKLTDITVLISDRISKIEEQQKQILLPKRVFTRWTKKMFPKYDLLMNYFNISRSELYHNLYIELENTYSDIDIKQLQDNYCYENNLDTCYPLDAIEHNTSVRMLFENLVDNLLTAYSLSSDDLLLTRKSTIFDQANKAGDMNCNT